MLKGLQLSSAQRVGSLGDRFRPCRHLSRMFAVSTSKNEGCFFLTRLCAFSILQYSHVFPVGFPSLHVVVANSRRRRLIPPYVKHAPRGALRRCTSEIVAARKPSNPQAYGRSVLGCIEADFVSTKEKH